jgi:hypothetical protein
MAGSMKPDKNGEVRVGFDPVSPLFSGGVKAAETMAKLWPQMLGDVEKQLGGPAEFVRIQPVKGSREHELVYRKKP